MIPRSPNYFRSKRAIVWALGSVLGFCDTDQGSMLCDFQMTRALSIRDSVRFEFVPNWNVHVHVKVEVKVKRQFMAKVEARIGGTASRLLCKFSSPVLRYGFLWCYGHYMASWHEFFCCHRQYQRVISRDKQWQGVLGGDFEWQVVKWNDVQSWRMTGAMPDGRGW